MESQLDEMLAYAEFIVWAAEVDTGFIDCPEAEELIDGYSLMYPNGYEKLVTSSPALWAHFLAWRWTI